MVKVSREQSERLRHRVLDAAVTELAVAGHASLAITAIAHRAGVATSAVYHRFPTKDHLVRAIAEERLEPTVGRRLDETITWIWGPTGPLPTHRRSSAERAALAACHQLLVAAAFPSGPRAEAEVLLRHRLAHGVRCRRPSRSSSTGLDPDAIAEVLLPVAVDLGAGLVMTGLGRPLRPLQDAMELVQAALCDPTAHALLAERTPRRRRPRAADPVSRHSHDALGTALLSATVEAVRVDGFAATTVADIARRAGTSTGAVYNRFSGKGGLLAESLSAAAGIGSTAGSTAVLVESLRVAPSDPEVAAAVAAVQARALRSAAALARGGRTGTARPGVARSATAKVLVAQPLGHWILGRILGVPENQWDAAGRRLLDDLVRASDTIAERDGTVSARR